VGSSIAAKGIHVKASTELLLQRLCLDQVYVGRKAGQLAAAWGQVATHSRVVGRVLLF